MSDENKIEWVFCNSCGQKTKHFVRAEHTVDLPPPTGPS